MQRIENASAVASSRSKRSSLQSLLEYALFRLVETALRLLPATWVDILGEGLGTCAYYLMPARRATVRRNCRIAWGESMNEVGLDQLTRDTFRHCGANLLSSTQCMLMSDEKVKDHVTLEGVEIVRETLQRTNSGAILALCHMGNWEILSRIGTLIAPGIPTAAFYRPLNNPWMNRMTMRRRRRSGTRLFSNKEGFNQAAPLLRSGGMLGILADQHAGRSGSLTPFFGRPTSCSPLVELLHRRTGAAVFYLAVKRVHRAHWHISIKAHPPETNVTTDAVMHGLEVALSTSPCDGFWFHDRWKMPNKRPFSTRQSRQSHSQSRITKPWRFVIISSSQPKIAAAARPAIEYLIHQLPHAEFEIINLTPALVMPHARFHTIAANHDWANELKRIDESKSYPLDLVVYFCDRDEITDAHKKVFIPQAIGLSSGGNRLLDINIPAPLASLTDPQTWWHFLRALGCVLPDSPP
jgi:lauroyl/myristoyl acyltransferase